MSQCLLQNSSETFLCIILVGLRIGRKQLLIPEVDNGVPIIYMGQNNVAESVSNLCFNFCFQKKKKTQYVVVVRQ